jgi:hypothetical protein
MAVLERSLKRLSNVGRYKRPCPIVMNYGDLDFVPPKPQYFKRWSDGVVIQEFHI